MVAALVTVNVAVPAVVPGVTVTVVPDTEHVATALLLVAHESVPPLVFFVTVNVPVVGYVTVPLVADNVTLPLALLIVTVLYPVLDT